MAISEIKAAGLKIRTEVVVPLTSDGWEAPSDGFLVARLTWDSSGQFGYLYVSDPSLQGTRNVIALSEGRTQGYSETNLCPVIKGHKYYITGKDHVSSYAFFFYPLF